MILDGLQSERLHFRSIKTTDFENFLAFFSDKETMKYYHFNESPATICRNWIKRQLRRYKKDGFGLYVISEKEGGNIVGQCGLLIQIIDNCEELEVGYGLIRDYWSKGYATEAARFCMDHAFQNNITKNIISIIDVKNENSARVAIRNGMEIQKTTHFKDFLVNMYGISYEKWASIKSNVL